MQKSLVLGLVAALLVSAVGGIIAPTVSAQYYGTLTCSPSTQYATSGQWITFSAQYQYGSGSGSQLTWSAVGGSPSYGNGLQFGTQFWTSGYNETRIVTVTDGYQTATCTVYLSGSATPTPTPASYGNVTVDHTVRNVTRGGSDATWVSASNGDRLQFTVRLTTGSQTAEDVHVRDWLPQYLSYIVDSTTLDGSWYQNGIATGNSNDSLALGYLAANRTFIVRFDATVVGAQSVTVTNSVNIHARGFTDQNRTSTIALSGSYLTPTPTPYVGGNGRIALSIAGRNVTRGQSGEFTTVNARGSDTLDLIVHVRSQDGQYLSNVIVSDSLPAGFLYIPGSTTVNGSATVDGIATSGLNIGTLAPWQDVKVKFSVRVDGAYVPTVGRTTITNSAQARADGTGTVAASLTLTLGAPQVITAAAGTKTGPMDSLLLAFSFALLATGAYASYTRTGIFGRRIALAEVKSLSNKATNFHR